MICPSCKKKELVRIDTFGYHWTEEWGCPSEEGGCDYVHDGRPGGERDPREGDVE
jgi:hypothetical protein